MGKKELQHDQDDMPRDSGGAAGRRISSIVDGPISAEVLSMESQAMVREAREVSSWSPNVVVKVPMSESGLEAVSVLSKEEIRTNLTLCFSINQAILGAIAGATYVSPFVGRLDDIGHDGMQLVAEIVEIFNNYKWPTKVIAASIRHPLHVVAAAKAGAHIATIPYSVLMQMIRHPLTDVGIARFGHDEREKAQQAVARRCPKRRVRQVQARGAEGGADEGEAFLLNQVVLVKTCRPTVWLTGSG